MVACKSGMQPRVGQAYQLKIRTVQWPAAGKSHDSERTLLHTGFNVMGHAALGQAALGASEARVPPPAAAGAPPPSSRARCRCKAARTGHLAAAFQSLHGSRPKHACKLHAAPRGI